MIRPYRIEDKESLVQLIRLNIPAYFAQSEEEEYVTYLNNELEDYFVMEYDDIVVGAGGINYISDEKTAVISWDLFHPDFQGKGLGRKLIQHRLDFIKNKSNIDTIQVRTSQLTFKFYEKMGFDLTNTEKDYWAPGFDLYQMRIIIND